MVNKTSEESKPICYPCIGVEKTATAIAESKNFYANLDPRDQKTPGRLFIQTFKHIPDTTDWSPELWQEFGAFSSALKKAVNQGLYPHIEHQLINLACLMNLAREEGTHTHWHLLPRFAGTVEIENSVTGQKEVFKDPTYGKPYCFEQKNYRIVSDSMMLTIMKKIQGKLDLSNVPGGKLKKLHS